MIKDVSGLVEYLSIELRSFSDVGVLGMSGGVDSTVMACLCSIAFGPENCFGIHMPYGKVDTDHERFNANSVRVADKLGFESLHAPVTKISDAITETVNEALAPYLLKRQSKEMDIEETIKLNAVNVGNARSRARMTVLYGIAHELNAVLGIRGRVMGTGNLSEDFIGYDTKGGDALCDIFAIGELFKSEVYQLAEYFVQIGLIDETMIDRTPSAGLWDGQTDESELGYTYDEMEKSIRKIATEDWSRDYWDEVDEFVWNRHFANKHKHQAPPVVSLRKQFCDGGGFRSDLYRPKE